MESHPYTKPRGVGPVTTQLTPGAEPPSSKSAGAPGPCSCSPTCRAWSETSLPSLTDSTSTGAGCTCSPCNTGAGSTCSLRNTGAGSTWSPRNTGAGSTWSPRNNRWATPSAFLHRQLDVTTSRTSTSSFRYELRCNSCYLLFGYKGTGAERVRLRARGGAANATRRLGRKSCIQRIYAKTTVYTVYTV